jgi:hypothetical protein
MFKPLACAALLVAVAAPLQAQGTSAKAPKIRIDFTQEKLPNGLTVIYSLDRSTPVVAVEVITTSDPSTSRSAAPDSRISSST